MEESLYHLFNEVQKSHWWFLGRAAIVTKLIEKYLSTRERISGRRVEPNTLAEIGCGTGAMIPFLEKFGTVYGIEASQTAIDLCRQDGFQNVYLHSDLQWQNRSFDALAFLDVIEHLDDDLEFVKHYLQWLKPGGWVVVTVPAFMWLWSEHDVINQHRRRYTRAQLRRLLETAGLKIWKASYFNSIFFPPIALIRLAKKLLPQNTGTPRADLNLTSSRFNTLFKVIFASERHWLAHFSFPVGISIICIAEYK
ncbi:class I SAM-dependent methyltransferase [candidate division KSB1 bacterium]|nr:class I SAM-dependent methyltransferase [candidate division KSB1 bacterium]